MCKAETCKRLRGIERGIFFGFVKKGGSNFTPWRIWLGTCQTGDTAAPTHRREEEEKKEERRPIKSGQTDGSTAIDNPVSQWETRLGRQMCGVYQ